MFQVTIMGRLGADVKAKQSKTGNEFWVGTLAVQTDYGQYATPTWVDVMFNKETAVKLQRFLTKGRPLVISGQLKTKLHNGQTQLTVFADRVNFTTQEKTPEEMAASSQPPSQQPEPSSDIPF